MIVIYHANCMDGFCGAWMFWKAFPDAKFIPCNYQEPVPEELEGKDVAVVDFSFPKEQLLKIRKSVKSLIVLDHHKTAQENLLGLPFCRFDMNKSGGRLAQEYLGLESNWIVDYTEDRDLWLHKLIVTKELNASLQSYPKDFATWNMLQNTSQVDLAREGAAILRYQEQMIKSHIERAVPITIEGNTVLSCECTAGALTSEIAGELSKGKLFAVCWFRLKDEIIFSLRSDPQGLDVSEIAKRFGGGGHKHAAGFKQSCPWHLMQE